MHVLGQSENGFPASFRGALFGLLGAMLLTLLLGFAPAGAQTTCDINDFRNPDGTLNLTGYLACQNAAGAATGGASAGSLPSTGSDVGRYLAIGGVLVLIGGVATVATRRSRRTALTPQ